MSRRIRLATTWGEYAVGTVLTPPDHLADILIREKIAVAEEADINVTVPAAECAAMDSPVESAMLAPPEPKKRGRPRKVKDITT